VIALPHAARIFLALGATDMRKSYDTLAQVTREKIGEEPLSGHLFVFCNGGRNRMKILYWDGNGYWLFAKRLERGTFSWPGRLASGESSLEMKSHELMALVGGIDLRRAVQRPRYTHPSQHHSDNRERISLGT